MTFHQSIQHLINFLMKSYSIHIRLFSHSVHCTPNLDDFASESGLAYLLDPCVVIASPTTDLEPPIFQDLMEAPINLPKLFVLEERLENGLPDVRTEMTILYTRYLFEFCIAFT